MSVIRLCNHAGDQVIAEFDPSTKEGVKVGQDALTAFLEDCISKHTLCPPVWKRRIGETDFHHCDYDKSAGRVFFDPSIIADAEEFVLQYPLVGG